MIAFTDKYRESIFAQYSDILCTLEKLGIETDKYKLTNEEIEIFECFFLEDKNEIVKIEEEDDKILKSKINKRKYKKFIKLYQFFVEYINQSLQEGYNYKIGYYQYKDFIKPEYRETNLKKSLVSVKDNLRINPIFNIKGYDFHNPLNVMFGLNTIIHALPSIDYAKKIYEKEFKEEMNKLPECIENIILGYVNDLIDTHIWKINRQSYGGTVRVRFENDEYDEYDDDDLFIPWHKVNYDTRLYILDEKYNKYTEKKYKHHSLWKRHIISESESESESEDEYDYEAEEDDYMRWIDEILYEEYLLNI